MLLFIMLNALRLRLNSQDVKWLIIKADYEVELCSISLKTEPILSLSTSFCQLI